MVFVMPTVLLETTDKCLSLVDGTLETQGVPVTCVDLGEGLKPLHENLTKYSHQLAPAVGKTVARKDDAVLLADDGEPLTIGGVSWLFMQLQRRSGIHGKRVSSHNCRRYTATTQLAMARSLLDAQSQMGHATLQMTNRYASLTIEPLQRTHVEYSPLRAKQVADERSLRLQTVGMYKNISIVSYRS
jgi:site-specific recombinase XerC